jgi:putative membrane protein
VIDLWIKSLHIISVISWMAGLLYLPRLFVYHASAPAGSAQSETFKTMERRLLRYIMNPAMVVVWLTGPWLAWYYSYWKAPWFVAKFVLVAALTTYHHVLAAWFKAFDADRNRHDARYFRIANEIPTVIMIGIVILVVVKPF